MLCSASLLRFSLVFLLFVCAACGDDDDAVCVPGVTQECLGPGRCDGAQACLPDGTGFAACECSVPGDAGPFDGGIDADVEDGGVDASLDDGGHDADVEDGGHDASLDDAGVDGGFDAGPLCDPACASGTCCVDECVDPDRDVFHCGGCGRGCDTNEICRVGACLENGVAGDDEVFRGSCAPIDCGPDLLPSACVCLAPPTEDLDSLWCWLLQDDGIPTEPAWSPCDVFPSSSADLRCNLMPGYRADGTPQIVTAFGTVDVFGNGPDSDAIEVAIYLEGPDGALGSLLGTATASIADSLCAGNDQVVDRGTVAQTRRTGHFLVPGIPTETPLIVRTSGDPTFWRTTYRYNARLRNTDVFTHVSSGGNPCFPAGPGARLEVDIVSAADWRSIPLTAGLVDGITSGDGMLIGEVRDCDNYALKGAQPGLSVESDAFVYFDGNLTNPLPLRAGARTSTDRLGMFGGLGVAAGPVRVSAIGRTSPTEVTTLGWYDVGVFPGAVTRVVLGGFQPEQLP